MKCSNKNSIIKIPRTRTTRALRKILYREGFIDEISESINSSTKFKKKIIILRLKYKGIQRIPVLIKLQRVSRPGLRIYVNYKKKLTKQVKKQIKLKPLIVYLVSILK